MNDPYQRILGEIERLRRELRPRTSAEGSYKHGWTNGMKFALDRVEAYLTKIERESVKL